MCSKHRACKSLKRVRRQFDTVCITSVSSDTT